MMFAQSLTLGIIAVVFPKFISNIEYLYYGMATVILFVFLFYALTLPKLSKELEYSQKKLAQRTGKEQIHIS